jgi:nitrite reductase/ring-hydroxylating ferredoxin subunit
MPEQRVPICSSDALNEGGPGLRFTVPAKVDVTDSGNPFSRTDGTAPKEQAAFLIRFHGQARAFLNRCGHVPIELDWEHGNFFDFSGQYLVCATHGALYAPESGRCVSGRCAGRGLVAVPLLEQDGMIYWLDSQEEK